MRSDSRRRGIGKAFPAMTLADSKTIRVLVVQPALVGGIRLARRDRLRVPRRIAELLVRAGVARVDPGLPAHLRVAHAN